MITKTKELNPDLNNIYSYFPNYDIGPEEKMTARQKQVLTELIYSKVSDAEAVEDWLQQIDSFSYEDAKRSIRELTESIWE
jgi:hypothetical protein